MNNAMICESRENVAELAIQHLRDWYSPVYLYRKIKYYQLNGNRD